MSEHNLGHQHSYRADQPLNCPNFLRFVTGTPSAAEANP